MREYDVEIKEILTRVQKVEASSLGEAIDKAMEMYYAQEIILDAEDFKGVDFDGTEEEIQLEEERIRREQEKKRGR